MESIEKSETLLAKWLSGEISQEELKALENTEDYHLFNRIAEESESFERPKLDSDKVYLNILKELEKRKKNTTKVRSLFNKRIIAVAASLALLISMLYLNFKEDEFITGYGERASIVLPDNSEVILNSKSSIVYNKRKWKTNRTLKLSGEAFFKVQKGSTFTVETNEGIITVLGTQFNVLENDNFLEVTCYEGKVSVDFNGEIVILTRGKVFTKLKNEIRTRTEKTKNESSWVVGESTFVSTPLEIVLKSLENQYNMKFIGDIKEQNKLFTGSFVHSDLNLALDAVLIPMNISYVIKKNNTIVLSR
ncbi:FecR family protein [Tenacibaculum amylolyticum]|uniref:FecR family protein n=1 Tax=Tenacibaculum amylolyticum TaxID=104269 RepID=UPI00389492CB